MRAFGQQVFENRRPHEQLAWAAKLNAARGRVVLMVPTRGLSVPNCEVDQLGAPGAFWDPPLDAAFRLALRRDLDSRIEYRELDAHVNDDSFALAVLETARAVFSG